MHIRCPHCGSAVPAENVNIRSLVAKCGPCSAVFGFADMVPGAALGGAAKRTVEMPRGYTLGNEGADLVITRSWLSLKYLVLLGFCLFWDGFLVFWYFMAFTRNGPPVIKLFPRLHVGVGVVLTYITLAGFLNRTRITLSAAELRIRHYPLPWPGNRVMPRQEIAQLFCEEKLNSSRNGGSAYTYALSAVTAGGGRVKLVSGLDAPESALFLEQKMEGYLGIADRPVPGEMRPF